MTEGNVVELRHNSGKRRPDWFPYAVGSFVGGAIVFVVFSCEGENTTFTNCSETELGNNTISNPAAKDLAEFASESDDIPNRIDVSLRNLVCIDEETLQLHVTTEGNAVAAIMDAQNE